MHDVEAPTPWYPVIHDFQPDLKTFFDWLDLPAPAGV
jgi:acetone carboxylase gamma subunit